MKTVYFRAAQPKKARIGFAKLQTAELKTSNGPPQNEAAGTETEGGFDEHVDR